MWLLAAAALAADLRPTDDPALRLFVLSSGGIERSAFVHAPEGERLPLVLVFHGGDGGEARGRAMWRDWDHLAGQGVAFAFPNGLGDGVRAWVAPGSDFAGDPMRDVTFVRDLVDALARTLPIDRSRVYAAGFSNGSGFTWVLQCHAADLFAGFGHVQQTMNRHLHGRCTPARHVPAMWIHGDDDAEKAAWDGNKGTVSVGETLAFVLRYHGCDEPSATVEALDRPGDRTRATVTTWTRCAYVPAWRFVRVHGGGHTWPTVHDAAQRPRASHDLDAADALLAFWRTYAGL